MNPRIDRDIECEIHRKDMHVRVIDVAEDRAILTHIVSNESYSKTPRDAGRIGKEVWNELGNATQEWWEQDHIEMIVLAIERCWGIAE